MSYKQCPLPKNNRWSLLLILVGISLTGITIPSLQAQPSPQLAHPFATSELASLYQELLGEIDKIPAIDNHAHPGYAEDPDVDAQAAPPGMALPLRLREDNPELVVAAHALFNYPYTDASAEHEKWLIDRKATFRQEYPGPAYFNRILDQVNTQISLANRVAMPDYLDPKRFRWVFFVDSFLFPFPAESFYSNYPDDRTFIPLQRKKLTRELSEIGVRSLPQTLPAYLALVTKSMELHKQQGGIAIKFEAAYFRPLTFGDPDQAQAAAIYRRYQSGVKPTYDQYLVLQDYIFRYLLRQAARLQLPVHIHSSVGIGDFFSLQRGNILNMEPILRDPRYDNVTFVLLHAGYPDDAKAIWLTARKNVYFDTSQISLILYPAEFRQHLKQWLTLFPDKLLFGSDAFPFNEAIGAEESYWISSRTARISLAAALSELISEGVLTKGRALEFAHAYLHDTAARLHHL
jgi:uncharacterized protein